MAERQDELNALTNLMRTAAGRRWLYHVLTSCHIYTTTFNTDAMLMAYAEGERSIGLFILGEMTSASAELYNIMMKEALNAQRPAGGKSDDRSSGDDDYDPDLSGNQGRSY